MRKIHLRLSSLEAFTYRLLSRDSSTGAQMIVSARSSSSQMMLKNPKLRRRVTGKVYIIDEWGSTEKWFCEEKTSVNRLWSVL